MLKVHTYSCFLLRPRMILLTSTITKSTVCDQVSILALWRYTSAEAGQISRSAHANSGCFPAPWAAFPISIVDPTATMIRQHHTDGPLSLRCPNRPRCSTLMTKYPNWVNGILASLFSIPTPLIEFQTVPRARYALSSCVLIGRRLQRSFAYILVHTRSTNCSQHGPHIQVTQSFNPTRRLVGCASSLDVSRPEPCPAKVRIALHERR
jgi:hypothetical protein